jgi:hypothetical protein
MLPNPGSARSAGKRLRWLAGAIAAVFLCSSGLVAQGSSTGNLSGTAIGPKGASVNGAAITLTKKLTGEVFRTITSPAGTYVIHDLPPGDYILHVEAQGFRPYDLLLRIQAALTATGDVRLQRLPPPPSVLIDAQSATIKSTQTSDELEQLPSSRNPFDLTFLSPAVQVLDGVVLGPTKSGKTSVSIAGRTGRTARMLVDGVDISDETMGAATQNVPVSSIQELKVEQSVLPLSSGLASAGAVNLLTKSGSNDLHGQVFGNFRDKSALVANFPGGQNNPYSREVFGGGVGGALKKDKLFFFLSGEYFKQDLIAPVVFDAPFTALDGSYRSPFRETELEDRLDYKLSARARLFYRFTYDNGNAVNSSAANNYQPFHHRDHSPGHAGGLDFTAGSFVHSLRFAYLRYSDGIADAVNGTSIFNPAPGISLNFIGTTGFASGPNSAAPQRTVQANQQVRYDGSRTVGAHNFRFGFALNKIDGLVFASLYSSAPQVGLDLSTASTLIAAAGSFPGGVGNPLNYPVHSITLGNKLGCFSEKSAFGSSCGGVRDTRLQGYAGDVWKLLPNLTLTYGVQYVRDTGRNSSGLPAIPCSAVNASFGSLAPCTGSSPLLNSFGTAPSLGNRVRQPNLNFAPQAGLAWDPGKSGRTVFRAGIGLYYDNSEFHNALLDRVSRLATGAFAAQSNDPCASHGIVILPGNVSQPAGSICNQPVGAVTTAIAGLQQAYQAAFAALTPSSPNPSFVGNLLSTQQGLLAPNFETPRSVQFNVGFEHQIGADTVFGADYLRNTGTHFLLGLDANHVGDSQFLQTDLLNGAKVPTAALNAITATVTPFGCPAATIVGGGPGGSQTAVNCYIGKVSGASIADFARHGLDSGAQYLGGLPASVFGLTPDTGAAFAGANPLVGRSTTFFPAGRSIYSGVQVWLRSQVRNPFRNVAGSHFQFSYTHSSYRSNLPGGLDDQDLLPLAADFNRPAAFFGSAPGDRKNQFSTATIFDLAMGLRLSLTGHIASPLPQTLFLPASGVPGEIFRTDVTGDGSFGGQSQTGNSPFGDVLPQTQVGAFGRAISAAQLNRTIENFNSKFADILTPAGQSLINAGLLSLQQMRSLGATVPALQSAPPGNVGLGWLRSFDASLAWPLKIRDRFTVEPRISAFNIFNTANFDGPGNLLGGILNGAAGQANGASTTNRTNNRVGFGSGVFAQGAPRQVEFGLKISF